MGGPWSPKILYPEWQNKYQVALLELDRKKLLERVTAAEPRSSIVFRPSRPNTLRNGRPSKMRWQICAFSGGTISDFL